MRETWKIGIICGKLGDVDGVSLEVDKWVEALKALGHDVYLIAGSYVNPVRCVEQSKQFVIPEMRFGSPFQKEIEAMAFPYISNKMVQPLHADKLASLEDKIWDEGILASNKMLEYIYDNKIDLLIGENTNAMPMTLSGGIAVYMMAKEHNMATIFHHHDFWWERSRFFKNRIEHILNETMPPLGQGLEHIVISSYAAHVLKTLKRVEPHIVPNCEDFDNPPMMDSYNSSFRQDLGFKDTDILALQPTRIIPRKRIEDSIIFLSKFVKRYPQYKRKIKFIISLYQGDESDNNYIEQIKRLCLQHEIELFLIADRVASVRGTDSRGRKIYTNRDVLVNADFATYLPVWEGFGNALLETYAAKLIPVVSTYLVYKTDIRIIGPRGIEVFDRYAENGDLIIRDKPLDDLHRVLSDPELKEQIVELNFKNASREFGLGALKKMLDNIIKDYGPEISASQRRLKKERYNFSV